MRTGTFRSSGVSKGKEEVIKMRTNTLRVLSVIVAAVMVLAGPCAWANESWGGHEKGAGKDKHFEEMSKELGLSAEQKEALAKQRESSRPKLDELRQKSRAAREALRAELDKAKPDEARISELVSDLKSYAGDKVQIMVDRMLAMKKVLTPEQSARMREIMEKKKAEFKEKGGRGHEGPPHEDM